MKRGFLNAKGSSDASPAAPPATVTPHPSAGVGVSTMTVREGEREHPRSSPSAQASVAAAASLVSGFTLEDLGDSLPTGVSMDVTTTSPLIVKANVWVDPQDEAPHFMYGPGRNLVIIDTLPHLQRIQTLPFWTAPSVPFTSARSFAIVDIAGKGKGLVATRDIQSGETIITEPLLLAIGLSIVKGPRRTARSLEETCSLAVQNLSPTSKSAFEALDGSGSICQPLPHVAKVMTNNWNGEFYSKSENVEGGWIVYNIISRANHSCAPNASFSRSQLTVDGTLRALRPIKAGAEITVTYTVLNASRSERRTLLATEFNFDCTCECCSLPKEKSERSDNRRNRLARFFQTPPQQQRTEDIEQLIQLAKKEALPFVEVELLFHGFQAYLRNGQVTMADWWAQRYREASLTIKGEVEEDKLALLGECGRS